MEVDSAAPPASAATTTTAAPTTTTAATTASSSTTTTSAPAASLDTPWVEKHRPRTLDDIVGNSETITRLRIIADQGNMPNIILSGPPGCGKTTSITCLARQMLGHSFENAVLELNASDARGIDVVRNKIKMFAQKKVTLPPGQHKIVILDEADSMTSGAQQAMRRTMELFSNTTRFALACNSSSKIIEPIQSRCAILRFTKLSDEEVLKRVRQVMEIEGIHEFTSDGLEALVFTSQGDLRHAMNNLQATATGLGAITADNVFKVVDQPHPILVKDILSHCSKGDLKSALLILQSLLRQGYAPIDVISTFFSVAKSTNALSDREKIAFIREISFAHIRIADGVATALQLTGLLARLSQLQTRSTG